MKKIREIMFSSKYSLQEKLFVVGMVIGLFSVTGVIVAATASNQGWLMSVSLVIALVVMLLASAYSLRHRKPLVGASVVILMDIFLIFPLGYLMGGGAYSGTPSWIIFTFALVFMLFKGKLMWIYAALTTLSFGGVTFYSYLYPEKVMALQGEAGIYTDTFYSAVVIGIACGLMMKFQSSIFEIERNKVEQQKIEIQKLNDSQNRFFSSMSHEIRTPINTIIGLNEMTLREKVLPEEIKENAEGIQNASKMLLSLINDILDMSKIQSGRMEVIEAQYETGSMLSDIVNLLWNRAKEKNLRFEMNVGDQIPSMLYGDQMRIKQILVNILTNAIKYTNTGSVSFNVSGEKTGSNEFTLRVDVTDTGIGIRREVIPFIFDSFKRVDESKNKSIEGTGLGLSIAKQLAELMHGSISVDSVYTKGSTFHVVLPQRIVNEAPLNYKALNEVAQERDDYKQTFEAPEARVLIVDDNEMNRVVAGKLLRGTQVKVDLVSSGRECLEKTAQIRYDAIFMDHEMPGMDGIEALGRVRSQVNGLSRETPVIALTANAGSDMSSFYIEKGFQAYLAKPIHSSLLEATLMQLLPSELIEKTSVAPDEEVLFIAKTRRKRPVMITTDIISDLPEQMAREYQIRMISSYCVTDEGRFRDGIEVDGDNLLQYLSRNSNVSTAPASVNEYENFFAEALTEADTVVHISMSASMSDGYANACRAAESFANVYVYDSKQLSAGIALQALEASKMAANGKSAEKIIEALPVYTKCVSTSFLIPAPRAMLMSLLGKGVAGFIKSVFGVEAVFCLKKGRVRLESLCNDYVTSTMEQFIKGHLMNMEAFDPSILFVVYSGCNADERAEILKLVERYSHFEKVVVQRASATMSCNSGMHAFGLMCMKRFL